MSRRALLGGATAAGMAAALTGCGSPARDGLSARTGGPSSLGTVSSDPASWGSESDVPRLVGAIADELAILAFLSSARRRTPASVLRLLADQQRQHVEGLKAALSSPFTNTAMHTPARRGRLEGNLSEARSLLLAARDARRNDALTADSGLLARLFASVSASHAVAAELDGLRG